MGVLQVTPAPTSRGDHQLFESRIRTKSGLEIFDKIFFGREVYNLDNIIIVIFQTFMANEFIIYFIRNK